MNSISCKFEMNRHRDLISVSEMSHGLGVSARMRLAIGGAGVALVASLLAGCGGSNKTLAKVGDQNITEKQFLQQAISTPEGAQILSGMMAEDVVTQEAAAKGVSPTEEEVNAELAAAEKANPQFEQSLAKDRTGIMRRVRELVCVENILKKEANVTPASEQQWWSTHHDLFDQQASVTVVPLVFDSMQKARQAEDLLKKGSSPKDVAASLGDPAFSANGVQSPPQTKQQALAVPALKPLVPQLFGPNAKPGLTTAPITDSPQKGKVMIIQIGRILAAKPATLAENKQVVEHYMAAEQYVKNHLHIPTPPQATASYYAQMSQIVNQQFVPSLLQDYYKANKITVTDPTLKAAIDAQFKAMAAASSGAGAPPNGAAPGPGPADAAQGPGAPVSAPEPGGAPAAPGG